MRALSGFLALGMVLLTAACDGGSTIATGKLSQLVLTEQDMPGFKTFYNGAQVRLDNQGTNRTDASRFGRQGGWISRLRPSDSAAATGPLVVESRADVFKTADGAKSDFGAYRVQLSATNAGDLKQFAIPGLAQDAIGVTFTEAGAKTLRFFRIAWRDRNATASVTVEGFDGDLTQDQAVALAQKQGKHIKGA